MLNKIALIIPTRQRVDKAREQSLLLRGTMGYDADIHYVIDGDPWNEHDYVRALADSHSIVHVQPWRGLSGTLNTMSLKLSMGYRYVGFIGDDHLPRSLFWDTQIWNAFQDPSTLIVYGPDGSPTEPRDFPRLTWWVMDTDLIHATGQMVPYVLSHTCVDDYVWQLGFQSGTLSYLPDVLFEHQHHLWNKGPVDESYERSSEHNNRLADNLKWQYYQTVQLPHDVVLAQRLRKNNGA
jgi:hypothetical protein